MPRRDPVHPLSPPAPSPRPVPVCGSRSCRGRTRECDPASPSRHPAPAGEAAGLPHIRQGVSRRRQQDPSAGGVGCVRGPAGDAPPVAPPARRQEVDKAAPPSGAPSPLSRGSRPDPPNGEGEPQVGLHADPGRAAQARGQGLGHHDRHGAPPFRFGSGSEARPHVEGVPPPPGGRDAGVRLPHRGDHHPENPARAGVDRARDEEGPTWVE